MDVAAVADGIVSELEAAGTPERAAWDRSYLKSELTHLGVKLPDLRRIVGAVKKAHRDLARGQLVALVERLWKEPIYDRRAAAMLVLVAFEKRLGREDVPLLERLLREARTWAIVDELAVHVVGPLAAREPALGKTLDRWARDEDFWLRRAALLALLKPLREGAGDFERFGRYADAMLEEKEL